MKEITPIKTWINGKEVEGNYINVSLSNDDLISNACFSYNIFSNSSGFPIHSISQGSVYISGDEYDNWGKDYDINEDAYRIVAKRLNISILENNI